jgi:hypothetical protein
MRRLRFGLAAAALLLLPQARALAWNSIGHMTVAKLAYEQMDDGLKARVVDLLKAHPHYESFLIAARPEGVSEPEWAVLRAATWPDWVRSKHPGIEPDPTTFHRSPDHYINLPLVKPADKDQFDADQLRRELPKDNVLTALERHAKVLASAEESREKKAVSLCWLLHLIGDIHQPLHCVGFFSRDFPNGDQGGNLFGVTIGGQGYRLHTYWDDLMGQDPPGDFDKRDNVEYQTKAYKLVKEAAERLHDPQYGRDKFTDQLGKTKFTDWADESFALAKAVGYRNGELENMPPADLPAYPTAVPSTAPQAPDDYAKKAHEVADRRVALAGYRLADRLKELLAKP